MKPKITKSDSEWKKLLTDEQYHIARKKGTEAPFSGKYYNSKEKGIYKCICCGNELFSSETKFDSGSGWPSYFAPVSENNVKLLPDNSLGTERVEVVCTSCNAHLGHVFHDGPKPSGLRYCINSAVLNLSKANE
ncbi:MAG: peptide-methionine (R)-S-oxide reductase MsrB [Candidatus Melainabacteria bacterium]|nr:peptide-methionine (R)-S-oxide reductase MsrB [Candidatus Melainabacteria bacterium]